jgi:hypothetical protein
MKKALEVEGLKISTKPLHETHLPLGLRMFKLLSLSSSP